jgi:Tfp pilus assembly protein PilV
MSQMKRVNIVLRASRLGLVCMGISVVALAPAHAKTCKEAIAAQARSTAQLSDASREKRAKDKAIANWSKRARDTHGWMYRFWSKSEEQRVDCGGTAKFKRCSVSAKPCTLW